MRYNRLLFTRRNSDLDLLPGADDEGIRRERERECVVLLTVEVIVETELCCLEDVAIDVVCVLVTTDKANILRCVCTQHR